MRWTCGWLWNYIKSVAAVILDNLTLYIGGLVCILVNKVYFNCETLSLLCHIRKDSAQAPHSMCAVNLMIACVAYQTFDVQLFQLFWISCCSFVNFFHPIALYLPVLLLWLCEAYKIPENLDVFVRLEPKFHYLFILPNPMLCFNAKCRFGCRIIRWQGCRIVCRLMLLVFWFPIKQKHFCVMETAIFLRLKATLDW